MTFNLQLDLVPLPLRDTKEAKERQRIECFAKEIEKHSKFLCQ